MVPDDLLEERPTGVGSGDYPGAGHFELAERPLVHVPGAQIGHGERGRQSVRPTPEEALHGSRPAPVADPLQSGRIITGTKTVVQGGVADPALHALPLRPLVTVQPDPDRIRRIRIGL